MTDAEGQDVYQCAEVRAVARLHVDLLTREARQAPIAAHLGTQAQRLFAAHASGDGAAATHIKCWHPQLVGYPPDEIMRCDFTMGDARETMAREHGFVDWADVEARGRNAPDPDFEDAVDALLAGDAKGLRGMLAARPELVHARSGYGHGATLLHYVGSNGVETWRQVVPLNLPEMAQIVIDAGADVNGIATIYGGSTTIALVLSSAHPAEAGVMDAVVKVLVDAGTALGDEDCG